MGGLGVLAWLGIGDMPGWTITRMTVSGGDDAHRGTFCDGSIDARNRIGRHPSLGNRAQALGAWVRVE